MPVIMSVIQECVDEETVCTVFAVVEDPITGATCKQVMEVNPRKTQVISAFGITL